LHDTGVLYCLLRSVEFLKRHGTLTTDAVIVFDVVVDDDDDDDDNDDADVDNNVKLGGAIVCLLWPKHSSDVNQNVFMPKVLTRRSSTATPTAADMLQPLFM